MYQKLTLSSMTPTVAGTLLQDGYVVLNDDTAPNFLCEFMTIQDYLAGENPERGFEMTMN